MDHGWLCEQCRSLNGARHRRCYRCHAPRRFAEWQEGSAAITRDASASGSARRTASAVSGAALGARRRPSWLVALVLVPMIAAVAVLETVAWPAFLATLRLDGTPIQDPVRLQAAMDLVTLDLVLFVASIPIWCAWTALVVGNVPAITGRWPAFSPWEALLAPLGLRAWVRRPMHVIRSIVDDLAGEHVPAGLLVTAWWLVFMGAYWIPGLIMLGLQVLGGQPMRQNLQLIGLRPLFMVSAGVLAIGVVLMIEWLQRHPRLPERA